MSRSLRRSLSSSLHWVNLLAVCSGVAFSAQTAFAYFRPPPFPPPVTCGITPLTGPITVGVAFGAMSSIYVDYEVSRGRPTSANAAINWGDGTFTAVDSAFGPFIDQCSGYFPNQICQAVFHAGGNHTYSAPMSGNRITVGGAVHFP